MYKSGKMWAFAGLVTTYFTVLTIGQGNLVHADTTSTPTVSVGQVYQKQAAAEATTPTATASQATTTTQTAATTQAATPAATTTTTTQAATPAAATTTTTQAATPAATTTTTTQAATPTAATTTTTQTATAPTAKAALALATPTMTASNGQVVLSGTAEPNATITATANGLGAGSTTASATGTYSLTVAAGKQVVVTEQTTAGESASVTVTTPTAPAGQTGAQTDTNAEDLNSSTTDAKNGVKEELNNGGGLAQGALFNDTAQGADNTATANLGDQDTADAAVEAANKQEADKKDSGYVKTISSQEQQKTNNDGWDEDIITVDGMDVKDNQTTTAADFYSDQGALASDYTDTDDDGVETIADNVRHVDLHSQVSNTGIAGRLIGGDTANTAVFKVADDLRDLKVGTWTVVATSNAGITVQNDDTGEFYAITDNSNNTSSWNVGDKIDGKAVVYTKYTGAMIDQLSSTITKGIGDLVTIPGQIANTIAGSAGGVLSGIIDGFAKDDSYANGLAVAKKAVDNDIAMEHYLMDHGVRIITLEDVAQDGHVLTVENKTNGADAIGNMVTGFVQGYVNDIKNYAMAFLGLLPDADGKTALESAISGGLDNVTGGSSDGGGLLGGLGSILDPIKDAAGGLVSGGATAAANTILDGITSQTDGIVDQISQGVKDFITGAVDSAGDASWGASQNVIVPISFKDPDFKDTILTDNMDPAFADGKFKAETIGVSANLFRQTDDQTPDYTTSTTIAYQIVNKTDLDHYITAIQKDPALIQKVGSDLQTAIYVMQDQDPATQGKTARTSSQKDVDEIVKKIQDKLETVPELTSATIDGNATDGYTVTGEGTPGADVTITDPAGTIIGTGKVGDDGSYTVPVDASVPAGTSLTVTPSLISPLTGDPVRGDTKTVTVPTADTATQPGGDDTDTTPTQEKSATPTNVTATGEDDGTTDVKGEGTPGATVEVKNPAGDVVGTGKVGADGNFDVTVPKDDAKPGDKLGVTETEPGKTPSDPATATVTKPAGDDTKEPGTTDNGGKDDNNTTPTQEKSAVPTDVTATGNDNGTTDVKGSGVPGATVEVKNPAGDVVGTGKVGDDGTFDVKVPKGDAKPGDKLGVTETEPGKDPSDATTATVTEPKGGDNNTTPIQEKSAVPTDVTATGNDDGTTDVKGSGVPGATVEVKNPAGDVIGTGKVGDDGNFDVKVPKGDAKAGDKLGVTETEPGKDPSDATTATVTEPKGGDDNTTPTQEKSKVPTDVTATGNDDGTTDVKGSGVPGATVEVKNPAGDVIGTGKVGDDGNFDVKVPKGDAKPGDKLGVTETEPGKDPSDPATATVTEPKGGDDTTKPSGEDTNGGKDDNTTPTQEKSEVPTDVTATGNDDGTTNVKGHGTPGATVEVKNPAGDVIGTGKVGDDGAFDVKVPKGDAKPGDKLGVTETEPGKDPSNPTTATVTEPKGGDDTTKPSGEDTNEPGGTDNTKPSGEDTNGGKDDNITPTQEKSEVPTDVTATGNDDGTTDVKGHGTPGATVEVKNPAGDVIGTGKVGDDGAFDVKVPKGDAKPGDKLGVTETEPGKDPSDATTATVTEPKGDDNATPTQEKSEVPTDVTATGNDDGTTDVKGHGTPGAGVEVKNPAGDVIGTGKVGDDGTFDVKIPEGAVKPGDKLGVTETEPGKDPSDPATATVTEPKGGDDTTKPSGEDTNGGKDNTTPTQEKSEVPTDVTATGNDDGTTDVKGHGTPGAGVEVKNPAGDVIGTGKVGDDGTFDVKIPEGATKPGDKLGVTETEPGKDPSDAITATVTEPKGGDDTTKPSGEDTNEPGGTDNTKPSGEDTNGGEDDNTTPTQEKSEVPTDVTATGNDDGTTDVKGHGTPGAGVEVKNPAGDVIGTGKVGDDGTFDVKIPEGATKPGDKLGVTETEPGKDPSDPASVTVTEPKGGEDTTKPSGEDTNEPSGKDDTTPTQEQSKVPTGVTATGNDDGTTDIKGHGTPGATVEVKNPAGDVIGSGKVGDDGTFDVNIPSGVVNPGDDLAITETEPGKTPSDQTHVKVPEANKGGDTTPTEEQSNVPTGLEVGMTDDGVYVKGHGTPGAEIEIKTPGGDVVGEGTVDGNGDFEVHIPSGVVNPGDGLDITETDPGKTPSDQTQVKVPEANKGGDTTPTEEQSNVPTGLEVGMTDDGVYVKGHGTPGAEIEIKTPGGDVVGEGTVDGNGDFEVHIPSGVVNPGDGLDITETDPGKTPSDQTQVKVPEANKGGDTTPTKEQSGAPTGLEVDVTDGGTSVKGHGTPGAKIEIKTPDGDVVGEATVDGNGDFEAHIPAGVVNPGDGLDITETDPGKTTSATTHVLIPDAVKSTTPTGLDVSATDDGGVDVSGHGTPGATVEVKTPSGDVIGQGTVDGNGDFKIHIPAGVVNPGDGLDVIETEAGKQPSAAATIKVPCATASVKTSLPDADAEGTIATEIGHTTNAATTPAQTVPSAPVVTPLSGTPSGTTVMPSVAAATPLSATPNATVATPVSTATTGTRGTLPATSTTAGESAMPATGDANDVAIAAFGGALVIGLIGLAGSRRKREF